VRRKLNGIRINRVEYGALGWAVSTLVKGLLVASVDGKHPARRCGVYGEPRGGLALAVGISHALAIPLLQRPRDGCIWIGLACHRASRYWRDAKRYRGMLPAFWIGRDGCDLLHARHVDDRAWIMFPWQTADEIEAEVRARARELRTLRLSKFARKSTTYAGGVPRGT
jgi:hypothetical protein